MPFSEFTKIYSAVRVTGCIPLNILLLNIDNVGIGSIKIKFKFAHHASPV